MNEKIENQLRTELDLGLRAERAYNSYLKEFIEREKEKSLIDFISASNDSEQLLAIKQNLNFILNLDAQVQSHIVMGKQASKKLETK